MSTKYRHSATHWSKGMENSSCLAHQLYCTALSQSGRPAGLCGNLPLISPLHFPYLLIHQVPHVSFSSLPIFLYTSGTLVWILITSPDSEKSSASRPLSFSWTNILWMLLSSCQPNKHLVAPYFSALFSIVRGYSLTTPQAGTLSLLPLSRELSPDISPPPTQAWSGLT